MLFECEFVEEPGAEKCTEVFLSKSELRKHSRTHNQNRTFKW